MTQSIGRITCPSCGQPFGAPIDQVLDTEVDPSAKARLLSGQVNVAICPHCGMAGALDAPFLYHDPFKNLAYVYMPLAAGRTDVERQQLIGALSRVVMNQMPPEQRKGYLLNPQVFFTLDGLIKKVLEAEGVTEEMVEAQQAKASLVQRLLQTDSEEEQRGILAEHVDLVDEEFLQILEMGSRQVEAMGQEDLAERARRLGSLLMAETEVGNRIKARAEALRALQEEPKREKLLELLIRVEDRHTRDILVTLGQELVDYFFFQALTERIEQSDDETQRRRLEALRKEVVETREQLREQARAVVERKQQLIAELTATERPDLLVRRRLAEIDELFFGLLGAEIDDAAQSGRTHEVERLETLWQVIHNAMEESMPPEIVLLTRIMQAEDDAQVRQLLEKNRKLVGPEMLATMEGVVQQVAEREDGDNLARLQLALEMMRGMVGPAPAVDKTERPSGLLMA